MILNIYMYVLNITTEIHKKIINFVKKKYSRGIFKQL